MPMDEQSQGFQKIVIRTSSALNAIAACLLFVLMIAGAADVLGRYLFNAPINGTMERSQLLVGLMVFLSWGYTQVKKGHVSVEIFIVHLPGRLKSFAEILTTLMTLALFILIVWQSFVMAIETYKSGEVVFVIHWPLAPFQFFVPLGGVVFCLVLIADIIQNVRQLKGRP